MELAQRLIGAPLEPPSRYRVQFVDYRPRLCRLKGRKLPDRALQGGQVVLRTFRQAAPALRAASWVG